LHAAPQFSETGMEKSEEQTYKKPPFILHHQTETHEKCLRRTEIETEKERGEKRRLHGDCTVEAKPAEERQAKGEGDDILLLLRLLLLLLLLVLCKEGERR
jgi:hypothetical protein